jgi:hypothetical protein
MVEIVASSLRRVLPVSWKRTALRSLPWSHRVRAYQSFWQACRRLSIHTIDDLLMNTRILADKPGIGRRKLQAIFEELSAPRDSGVMLPDHATFLAGVRYALRVGIIRDLIARLESAVWRPSTSDLRDLFGRIMLSLPRDRKHLAIHRLPWSQRNRHLTSFWEDAGVTKVLDLVSAGARLSRVRSLGSRNLLEIVADLVRMDPQLASEVPVPHRDPIGDIVLLHDSIAGQTAPSPDLIGNLYSAILDQLPQALLDMDLISVPWSREWCFQDQFWSMLGVRRVSDLKTASRRMRTFRGIGRTKILLVARDLIRMDPVLHSKLAPQLGALAESCTAATIAATAPRECDPQIGEVASHLSDVDRDILERRLWWRNQRPPATLAEVGADHGVTRARVQQRQSDLARILCRLPALRHLRERLLMAAGASQRSAARTSSLNGYREEIDYVLNNFDFLSRLYASNGEGPPLRERYKPCGIVIISVESK